MGFASLYPSYEFRPRHCPPSRAGDRTPPMRDVVTGFYSGVLEKLIGAGKISRDDKVLVVCGGPLDRSVVAAAGFKDFVITGLEGEGEQQDAERLTYADASFDVVIAH